MERLTYTALEQGRYDGYLLRQAPERVLQFGEGNFLRGFAEHFIDVMNERTDFQGKVVVVPPASAGKTGRINDQEGLYQLCLRGRRNGETVDQCRIVSCISRAVDVFEEYALYPLQYHRGRNRLRAVQPDGRPPPRRVPGQARTAAVGTLPDRTAGVHHFSL